jgi:hypothetical protein
MRTRGNFLGLKYNPVVLKKVGEQKTVSVGQEVVFVNKIASKITYGSSARREDFPALWT